MNCGNLLTPKRSRANATERSLPFCSAAVFDDVNWGIRYPSYWVADAILGYSTKLRERKVTFQLSSTNLTNKTYFTGNRMYGAPREFAFSTRVTF